MVYLLSALEGGIIGALTGMGVYSLTSNQDAAICFGIALFGITFIMVWGIIRIRESLTR